MTALLRDLWSDDIRTDDVLLPEDILRFQANALVNRTHGLLESRVSRMEAEDRVVLGLEAKSVKAEGWIRLFDVQHGREFEYPASVIPPPDTIPPFLKKKVFVPGKAGITSFAGAIGSAYEGTPGKWVENEWVASTPVEFIALIERVLTSQTIKSVVISLLAKSAQASNTNGGTESAG